nr:hypothetical protein [Ralstonia solanacearum]
MQKDQGQAVPVVLRQDVFPRQSKARLRIDLPPERGFHQGRQVFALLLSLTAQKLEVGGIQPPFVVDQLVVRRPAVIANT